MNDWNMWLASSETRTALRTLDKQLGELEGNVINGYLLQHDSADKIAVDYAHKVGIVEGFNKALQMILDIKDLVEEDDERS